jgi:cholesterol oxidase
MESTQLDATTFDFVIIGSGFGGSVSAMRLSEKGYRVLILERGKRYRPEDFPSTNWNVFKSVWLPAARCFGIMGINLLPDILILNGSGVGGGSLVYASTHHRALGPFLRGRQMVGTRRLEGRARPHFATANRMLGVTPNPYFGPADEILLDIAVELGREATFAPTPVAIYFGEPGRRCPIPSLTAKGPTAPAVPSAAAAWSAAATAPRTPSTRTTSTSPRSGAPRFAPKATSSTSAPSIGQTD